HVVLVAGFDRQPALEVDAERGPIERRFDVMSRERVAGEEHLHEAELDQPRQVAAASRVDDGRTAHDQDPAAVFADLLHLARDLRDEALFGLLDRDPARHEAEELHLAGSLERHHPHALVADHDAHARLRLAEGDAPGPARLLVHGDGTVHLLPLDGHPAAIEQDQGGQVGGRVEALREDAGLGYRLEGGRGLLRDRRTQLPGTLDDAVEALGAGRGHLDPAVRGVVLVLPDAELLDCEVAALVHDHVHDLGQDQGVDDVSLKNQERRLTRLAHAAIVTSARIRSRSSRAARPGSSAQRTERLALTRQPAGSPVQAARTDASRTPPWAPTPDRRNRSDD